MSMSGIIERGSSEAPLLGCGYFTDNCAAFLALGNIPISLFHLSQLCSGCLPHPRVGRAMFILKGLAIFFTITPTRCVYDLLQSQTFNSHLPITLL